MLELDPSTGRIARLVVKATGVDLAAPRAPHAVVVEDRSDTWGHGVRTYDGEAGSSSARRSARRGRAGAGDPARAEPLRRLDDPARGLRAERRRAVRRRPRRARLARAAEAAEAALSDFGRRPSGRRSRFRTATSSGTQAATRSRASRGSTCPDERGGLTVINDAKYGYDVRGGDIGVSAVRSPVWAWHDPRELDPEAAIRVHGSGPADLPRPARSARGRLARRRTSSRLAAELNQPPFALIETYHDGPLPQRASYADDGGGTVVVTVVKRAEDGDAAVVRAYEATGRAASGALPSCFERELEADFGAGEIKTFRVPRAPATLRSSRRTCSSGDVARRRRLAAARVRSARSGVAREQAVGCAGLAARARSGQRRSTTFGARARSPIPTTSANADSRSGCPSARGSIAGA